jgi:hypothetical protein
MKKKRNRQNVFCGSSKMIADVLYFCQQLKKRKLIADQLYVNV